MFEIYTVKKITTNRSYSSNGKKNIHKKVLRRNISESEHLEEKVNVGG